MNNKLFLTSRSNASSGVSNSVSRREAMSLLGLGVLAIQFPFGCGNKESAHAIDSELPLWFLTITEISERIRKKEITSVQLTTLMLDRITTIDAKLNSYITVLKESALSTAAALDKELANGNYRGPLHGVPIAVKDIFYTKGVRTTGGTYINKDFIPDFDATVMTRLKDAGAVILGKLNMSEGAYGAHHPEFGVPKNPWDVTRWPGVSSSGSGVATAAGLCFGSLGTDTGGSIRYPSASNGIVGLKPTFGRVSRHGVMPLALSMDHVGPMTRSVADTALMYEVIAGADPNDSSCLVEKVEKIVEHLDKDIKGLRIGFDREYASRDVQPQVTNAVESALKVLEKSGAEIVAVKMPDATQTMEVWEVLCAKEVAAIHAATYPSRAHDYGPQLRDVLKRGLAITEAELNDALKAKEDFALRFNEMLETLDAFVCPVDCCIPELYSEEPPGEGDKPVEPITGAFDKFAKPANFAGCPSLTIPGGFSEDGLPIGFQIIGRRMSEALICRIGYAYEQNTDWHNQHPKV